MKNNIFILLFFVNIALFAQKEANIWYFGYNAGLDFNSGSPVALTNGQLNTQEGCATICTNTGQLIFYTDGVTVYNKNHQIMTNGIGLMGDTSTTQSATIVQKPGSANLFYIFTLDALAGANGFRYSIVDINLNGGLGNVTSTKNVLVYTPSNEKLCIVKHVNGIDYWVVTHGFGNNTFYSHLLTSAGLSNAPILSNVGTVTSGDIDSTIGYMKISPDGSKLAIANAILDMQLFDFNTTTGQITNPVTLFGNGIYGIEFSPNGELLYATDAKNFTHKIYQFNLNASNIQSSIQTLWESVTVNHAALQLGPDGKIYIAQYNDKLSVINNPNTLGLGCNFQLNTIDLAGRGCVFGLPPFVSSFFFTPLIQFDTTCEGDNVTFTASGSQNITSVSWDFGDGSSPQNSITGNHIYTTASTYPVTATVTTPQGVRTNTRNITIYPKPIVTPIVTLKQCDDNIDGFSVFNLSEANAAISSNAAQETFAYFETLADAQNNTNPILNYTAYTNQVVSNDLVYVRVSNANGCFKTATLNLVVSTTQIPLNFNRLFTACDDAIMGTNTDGIASFDFSSVTGQIQGIFPTGQQLIISYYKNLSDALAEQNAITNIANYRNIGSPNTQNIYIRVDSALNNDCLGLGQHITLSVERIPIVMPQVVHHCDDNQDGIYGFDTTNVQTNLLNGLTNVSVAYYDSNNNPLPSPLPNPYVTVTQTIKVVVTNTTPKGCDYTSSIQFIVDDLPEAFALPTTMTTVCDDEADPNLQNGVYGFDTSGFEGGIVGNQTGMLVRYYDGNNNPLPSPLPNPFVSGTQNLVVEVINPLNSTCKANVTIPLIVKPVPKINLLGNEVVCNEPSFTKIIDAGITDGTPTTSYTYVWKRNGQVIPSANGYTLTVFAAGVYTVEVTNTQGCSSTRTITVIASDKATVTSVQVLDLVNQNSITVYVSGAGNYVYALDDDDGVYQDSASFSPVSAGIHTVYIKDLNGCGTTPKDIAVLGIPDYFTPNGDGYNDYWTIKGANATFNTTTVIYIFDRFGKLLKEISPTGLGWDGTFNNEPAPATDYWYAITLADGRTAKGHFALKR